MDRKRKSKVKNHEIFCVFSLFLGFFGLIACGKGASTKSPSEQGPSNFEEIQPNGETGSGTDSDADPDAVPFTSQASQADDGSAIAGSGYGSASADGVTVGNGGDGIGCIDEDGTETVELLDYFEAETQWGLPVGLGALEVKDPYETVERVLDRLKAYDRERASDLRIRLRDFKLNAVYLPNIDLENISDSKHIGTEKGCKLVQLARQIAESSAFESKYTVDADRFAKLSLEHQAGLILHEIIYNRFLESVLIDAWEPNSRPVRYFNALISAAGMEEAGFTKTFYEKLRLLKLPIALSLDCFGQPALLKNNEISALALDDEACKRDRFEVSKNWNFSKENSFAWRGGISTRSIPSEKDSPYTVLFWDMRRFRGLPTRFTIEAVKSEKDLERILWIDASPMEISAGSSFDFFGGKAELSLIEGNYTTKLKRFRMGELLWRRDGLKAPIDEVGFFPNGRVQHVEIFQSFDGKDAPVAMNVCPKAEQVTIPLCPGGFAYFDQEGCIIYADICPAKPILLKEGFRAIPRSMVAIDRDGSVSLNLDRAKDLSSGETINQELYSSRWFDDFMRSFWIDDPLLHALHIETMDAANLKSARTFFATVDGGTAALQNFPTKILWLREGKSPIGDVFRARYFYPNGHFERYFEKEPGLPGSLSPERASDYEMKEIKLSFSAFSLKAGGACGSHCVSSRMTVAFNCDLTGGRRRRMILRTSKRSTNLRHKDCASERRANNGLNSSSAPRAISEISSCRGEF